MAKINSCFKKTFIFFNALFAIFGVIIFGIALFGQQYAEEENTLTGVIFLYVIGSGIFIISVLGVFGAYKESKCALIMFFVIMCLMTGGMLRVAVPIAIHHAEINSAVQEYLKTTSAMNKDMQHALNTMQVHFKCCGLSNGYQDWQDDVPESCNCEGSYSPDMCKSVVTNAYKSLYLRRESTSRRVWSKPCGPVITEYLNKLLNVSMAIFFTFAAVAILGGLMSLIMIIKISAPTISQMPAMALSYQPPKYSEVVNY
ncbi:tetraspanin-8-like [Tachysurus fulvidraco]|uniref:tetraspanin-8-like n=1 Tax=Tachysurus fulvidraco TaxID=1234273 RepID=UPI000F4E2F5A|nr:tetraspanin-8-like [Tachysurus fulvidraco]